jgi:hypothetical protein
VQTPCGGRCWSDAGDSKEWRNACLVDEEKREKNKEVEGRGAFKLSPGIKQLRKRLKLQVLEVY